MKKKKEKGEGLDGQITLYGCIDERKITVGVCVCEFIKLRKVNISPFLLNQSEVWSPVYTVGASVGNLSNIQARRSLLLLLLPIQARRSI